MGHQFVRDYGTLYLRNVPRQVRNNFQAACYRRGKSMKEVVLKFMKEYAADDGKVNTRRKK